MPAADRLTDRAARPGEPPWLAETAHLGAVVGDARADRIVALSTSAVFEDPALIGSFRHVGVSSLDSGLQGHLYTRPRDILAILVPALAGDVVDAVKTAIAVNHDLWRSVAGIGLVSPAGRLILASDAPSPPAADLPANLTWHQGSLLEAATSRWRETDSSFLAFVLDTRVAKMLGAGETLAEQAQVTSLLMDKNVAMRALRENGIDCAKTYGFSACSYARQGLGGIPSSGRYVFKPAGGAAGIGVFSNGGAGANLSQIQTHVDALELEGRLPRRFQIQEFVSGTPHGISAWFAADGRFQVLQAHEQLGSESHRFVGARWTSAIQAALIDVARLLCRQLAAIEEIAFRGLVNLDVIDGKVIEVNPRLSAAAPIAHILRRHRQLAHHVGGGFHIGQIDLNTNLAIGYELMRDGRLRALIDTVRREHGVTVLPQGLNPFGSSRVVFINDDRCGSGQKTFVAGL